MSNRRTFLVIMALAAIPLAPVFATESLEITSCSRSDSSLSFTDLTTEGDVVSGAAIIPKGADVSFSVKVNAPLPPGSTTLKAYFVINSIPVADTILVAGGDLGDLSDVAEVSSSRTFVLRGSPSFPNMKFKARFSIRGSDSRELGCFEFPASYVSANA